MKPNGKDPERGQIIIILALVIIVLLGFAGLAIDGGMVYADRRNEQNASDAASLAGAGKAAQLFAAGGEAFFTENWNCNGADFIGGNIRNATVTAAQNSASSNGFTNITPNDPENGVGIYCSDGSYNYYDVAVTITKQTQTSFAQLIFNHPMINFVHATSRVFPRKPSAGDNAIVSLNKETSCNGLDRGMVFEGTSTVTITNGTVHSNSCIKASGGAGVVFTDEDQIGTYNWTYTENGNGWHLQPAPVYTTTYLNPVIPAPSCTGTSLGSITSSGSYPPGKYNNINITSNSAVVHLQPGLYCIQGPNSGVKVSGGTFTGENVTIYLPQADSLFNTQGNATVNLSAPPADCDVNPIAGVCGIPGTPDLAIGGVLIYKSGTPTGNQGSSLGGNANSTYEGTVYCPESTIRVDGTAGLKTIEAQIIGLNVYVSGSPGMNIIYDGNKYFHDPVKMQLHR